MLYFSYGIKWILDVLALLGLYENVFVLTQACEIICIILFV